jgi:hypothetical protein
MAKFKELLEAGKLKPEGPREKDQPKLEVADCCQECKWGSSFSAGSVSGRCDKYNRKVYRENTCSSWAS